MENPIQMDDLGGKPTIFRNIHMCKGRSTPYLEDGHPTLNSRESLYHISPPNTIDASEIRRSPVEVGRLSHYLRGILAPSKRWLFDCLRFMNQSNLFIPKRWRSPTTFRKGRLYNHPKKVTLAELPGR